MKKNYLLISAMFLFVQTGFALNAEKTAQKLLNGYKDKNVKVVKKYVSGLIVKAISPKYFEDDNVKDYVEDLQDWNGKIRGVRYAISPFATMAAVYYDEGAGKGKIKVICLSKVKKWVQFGIGFDEIKKTEYISNYPDEKLSPKKNKSALSGLKGTFGMFGPGKKKKASEKKGVSAEDTKNKGYAIEVADGPGVKAPSIKELKKSLASLSDDNFYLTLNGPEGFMQGSYSKKGMDMQYKDEKGQFTCVKMVSSETAECMFSEYLLGKSDWEKLCEWEPMK
ncbi:MAG: hypothetical protein J7M11_04100 [Elusimicrobia bacterium]|nr:hypothetical protein [Elusimicrobiota bacterium]